MKEEIQVCIDKLHHRRRIELEGKAKVVASVWGQNFFKIVLIQLFLSNRPRQNRQRGRELNKFCLPHRPGVQDSQSPNNPLQSPNRTYSHPTAPHQIFVKKYTLKVSFASLKSIFLEKDLQESVKLTKNLYYSRFFTSKMEKQQLKERKFAQLSNDDIQKTCHISKAVCLFYVLVLLTTSADTDQDIL